MHRHNFRKKDRFAIDSRDGKKVMLCSCGMSETFYRFFIKNGNVRAMVAVHAIKDNVQIAGARAVAWKGEAIKNMAKEEPFPFLSVPISEIFKEKGECSLSRAMFLLGILNSKKMQLDNYGWLRESGKGSYSAGAPCFGAVRGHISEYGKHESNEERDSPVAFFFSCNLSGNTALHLQRKYINYVINRSPLAHVCLVKDLDFAVKKGMVYDVNQSAQEVIGAAVLMRQRYEYPHILENFELLTSLNTVPEDLCFVLSQFFCKVGYNQYDFGNMAGGHNFFSREILKPSNFANYRNKKIAICNKDPFKVDQIYYGINDLFGKDRTIFDLVAKAGIGIKTELKNPWGKPIIQTTMYMKDLASDLIKIEKVLT